MNKIYVLTALLFVSRVYAVSAPIHIPPTISVVSAPQGQISGKNAILEGSTTLEMYVHEQSVAFDINPKLTNCIVTHESSWISDKTGPEKIGASEGLWQIDLFYHPTITKEQADNVQWATSWALTQIAAGRVGWWSTYDEFCRNIPIKIKS